MTDEERLLLKSITCFKSLAINGETVRVGFERVNGDLVVIEAESLKVFMSKKNCNKQNPETCPECGVERLDNNYQCLDCGETKDLRENEN